MDIQKSDATIRTSLLTAQLIIIALNLVLIVVVINKRKCKVLLYISVLVTILLLKINETILESKSSEECNYFTTKCVFLVIPPFKTF